MTYLITGATGLIGSALVRTLAHARDNLVLAAVRNVAKAEAMFSGFGNVRVVEWDVTRPAPDVEGPVDYLVHAASETSSQAFVDDPDGVRRVIVEGTRNALELARAKQVKGMVFLSTFEVLLGLTGVRASYPNAKLEAERLCAESGLPVRIARLAQTFGAGVRRGDRRVFAQFAEAVIEGRDIVLHTEGRTARCYCAIEDAVSAVRLLLTEGNPGEAYVVANPETYCTIREMAERLSARHPATRVTIELAAANGRGYAPEFQMKLDSTKLESLGWRPKYGLDEMFESMIANMVGNGKIRPEGGL